MGAAAGDAADGGGGNDHGGWWWCLVKGRESILDYERLSTSCLQRAGVGASGRGLAALTGPGW